VKLIDAFMFFDELDLLEIRLNEMSPIVDTFVIVESLERVGSAEKKPPILYQNWERFNPFTGKIRHILLQSLTPEFTGRDSGWLREYYQRNSLMGGILEVAAPEDVVIISDCDEIPRAVTIKENLSKLITRTFRLKQEMFHYSINRYVDSWNKAVAGTVGEIQRLGGPESARAIIPSSQQIENAGWHFSYFGGAQQIREKVGSFSHSSDDICTEFLSRSESQAAADIALGKDIFRRGGAPFIWRETTDPRLPSHFLNNLKRYEHFTEDFLKGQL
jgi:beta-1,4-mannosyl-glycoprotein beta-1,4-N-acetylglucosaminyltransferase